jgi:hypothetical protein
VGACDNFLYGFKGAQSAPDRCRLAFAPRPRRKG